VQMDSLAGWSNFLAELEASLREFAATGPVELRENGARIAPLSTYPAEPGTLDVLSATRAGRLTVRELKTSEHPVFLRRSAKYWLRIRRHLEQQDFARYGYFAGITLQPDPPIIYLVAPACASIPPRESYCTM